MDQFIFTDLGVNGVRFGHNSGGELVMTTAVGDQIIVTDHFRTSTCSIEELRFADGTTLNLAGIQQEAVDYAFIL